MPITRLYYPDSIETGKTLCLDKNASHHLIRVMRTKKGADIILFNGDGFEYASTLVDDNSKSCSVQVTDKKLTQRESPIRIILIQGISRGDRMDTCLQKSTELGVNVIVPVICERTTSKLKDDRAEKKTTHWKQVIVSACEQSGRCVVPELQPIITYTQALQADNSNCKLVLAPDSKKGLKDLKAPTGDIHILVGPEGGLTQDEVKLAHDMSYTGIYLGPRILRTETAGPACIASIQALWGDMGGVVA